MTLPRSRELLHRGWSRLLIVDVQTKFVPVIHEAPRMIGNCRRLLAAAQLFDIPASATEQYPQGLGETVPELAALLKVRPAKSEFSAVTALGWPPAAEIEDGRCQILVAGIESHVCVLQTVCDLLSLGYQVFVPADAVSSRREFDWQLALRRMEAAGAAICTTESVLFEWCETSTAPQFKEISRLVKEK